MKNNVVEDDITMGRTPAEKVRLRTYEIDNLLWTLAALVGCSQYRF